VLDKDIRPFALPLPKLTRAGLDREVIASPGHADGSSPDGMIPFAATRRATFLSTGAERIPIVTIEVSEGVCCPSLHVDGSCPVKIFTR
jgi:hypothetical protein